MAEKPILFSGEMVRAILDGRKTQTRRVIKPQPLFPICPNVSNPNGKPSYHVPKSKYQVGDILYVKETYGKSDAIGNEKGYFYKVFDNGNGEYEFSQLAKGSWKPSIYMPKSAARIFLRVTDLRVERLQEITAHDCRAEGIKAITKNWNDPNWSIDPPSTLTEKQISNATGEPFDENSAWWREWYSELWDSLNKKRGYSWESNPFVRVITFERIDRTDEMER